MKTPVAVLTSDIHYNMKNLEPADMALNQAVTTANELEIPLIIAGDLHDSKADMRSECFRAITSTLKMCNQPTYLIRGNHDSDSEKSQNTILTELPVTYVITDHTQVRFGDKYLFFIAYQADVTALAQILRQIPSGSTIIMHQGVTGSDSGEYIIDKTAMEKVWFERFRVISGHYHKRQDIKCGRPQKGSVGLFSYIGSPYTQSFGEANDPEKGYQVLYSDGSLEFIPTNLRKHVIVDLKYGEVNISYGPHPTKNDIVWIKLTGTKEELSKINKDVLRKSDSSLPENFKLDLIPLESEADTTTDKYKELSQPDALMFIVDSLTNVSDEQKNRLKKLLQESM